MKEGLLFEFLGYPVFGRAEGIILKWIFPFFTSWKVHPKINFLRLFTAIYDFLF